MLRTMCHADDSRPPASPRHGVVADRGFLTLTASDGGALSAFYAEPAEAPRAGVVVLPDVRGLHAYYVSLAERFAEAGLAAVAVDYFGRSAGPVAGEVRTDDFDWKAHLGQVTADGVDADITAAIALLRQRTREDLPILTVGFCFGGSQSWRQSGGELDLAGCVGFYGRPEMVGPAAAHAAKPTLMLIAGADAATSVEDQLRLAGTMRASGADVEAVVYDGAPHSFFDRSFDQWTDACQDAWVHVLALADRVS
jgi:carboxymethylenebutenolidase